MANKIQTIMRTAAMIYAEDQSIQTVKSVRRRFVDALFVNSDNAPLRVDQIIPLLQKDYEIVVQEKEIGFLDDERYYDKVLGKTKQENTYYLPNKRFEKLKEKTEYCIDDAIEEFSTQKPDVDLGGLRDLLYKYLYTLLNTNISAYTQLLERKGKQVSPVIDSDTFNDEEIETINCFINWDNPNKNKALFELVNYCIEYATAINSIDPQDVVNALKNKKLYLDNALIYRALGINGSFRQERVFNLLQRCIDSGQQLLISSVTRKEFFETIDYHIGYLRGSTPYGHINPSLFRRYTGGYTLYQYYYDWRRTNKKNVYGFELFSLHIKNEYNKLLQRFKIVEDFKQLYGDNEEGKIEQYAEEIKQYKRTKNDSLHLNDAKNMVWVELARGNCDNSVRDTKYYFVTSDRRLQEWDLHHSKNQPITMLPSQWLALLLKYYSQSNDDYKSFVSFLTIPNEKSETTPEELQDILAGISEITEDFQEQDDIVSALFDSANSREIRNRVEAQKFAQSKLESKFKEELKTAEIENQKKLEAQEAASQKMMSEQNEKFEKMLETIRQERQKDKLERLKDKLQLCTSQLKDKESISKQINSYADGKKNTMSGCMITIAVLYLIVMVFLIVLIGWNEMEQYTYISALVMTVALFVYSLIMNKNLEFWNIPTVCRERCYKRQCNKYAFDESEIADLQETIELLNKQITELENSLGE